MEALTSCSTSASHRGRRGDISDRLFFVGYLISRIGKPDAKATAAKAAKAVKKGTFKRTRKPRYSVVFHRPATLKRTRDPKYTRLR